LLLQTIFGFLQRMVRFPFRLFTDKNSRERPLLKAKRFLFDFERSFKHFSVEEYWMKRGKFYLEETMRQEEIYHATQLVLRIVSTQTFDSLLDFGCGYGKCLKPLSKHFAHKKLVGVDISSTMLQEAKNYLADSSIELHKTDGVTLPFADNSFDITLTSHVLIHNPPDKTAKIIKEIKRVTKKTSIHMESTVQNEDAEDYYCHDYEHLFVVNGGKPKLVAEFGKQGKIYIVNWL
jgi:ubiquinone/menaquinone biosynthesis C-methylase UbiE